MRQARKYHTCGEFVSTDGDNLGYAAGGIGIDAEQESLDEVELKSVEVYYFNSGEWVYIQSLPTSRSRASRFDLHFAHRQLAPGHLAPKLAQNTVQNVRERVARVRNVCQPLPASYLEAVYGSWEGCPQLLGKTWLPYTIMRLDGTWPILG